MSGARAYDGTTVKLPKQVHFLMNDKCNARCVMCGGDYYRSTSGRRITLEKFRRMAGNLRLERFGSVVLSGAGDPLLNPDLLPIVRHVRKDFPKVNVMLTTNGIALNRELAGALLDLGIGHVNISINAGTRETYRRVMQVDRFDDVCRNAAEFLSVRNRIRSGAPLQLSCAIHRRNVEELPLVVELGKRIGIDSINVLYCRFYPEGIRNPNVLDEGNRLAENDSLFHHQELSDRVVEAAKALARRSGIALAHEPLFRENAPARRCAWHESEIMVGFDGEIFPCGGAEVHFREKVGKGIYRFGNALSESIDDFWNGEMYRALRISSRGEGDGSIPECGCCANRMRPNDVRSHIMRWEAREAEDGGRKEAACPRGKAEADPPLVSVIVPTFNRPDMLEGCLESILAQTFARYEVIVVNDAGAEVEAIVAGLNTRGNLVYARHGRNRGLAAARNTGIRLARGKYIAYLDDDDRFHPDHLETLVGATEDGKYKVVYSDAYRVRQSRIDGVYVETGRDVQYSFDFDADRILAENFIPVLCFLHEKACLDDSGPFDESLRVLEDWDLWIRMSRAHAFRHVPKVTCEFVWKEDGSTMTSSRTSAFWETIERLFRKHAALAKDNPRVLSAQRQVLRMIRANRAIARAADLYREGRLDEGIGELEDLVAADPRNAAAHKELGVLYHYRGDDGRALSQLGRSLEIDGNLAARKDLARLCMKMGNIEGAVSACEEILREAPGDVEFLTMLMKICGGLGLKDKARAFFGRIREITKKAAPAPPEGGSGAGGPAPDAPPEVSIIVPVFNQVSYTRDCLSTLLEFPGDVPREIIVVDDGSTDGTAAYLETLSGRVRVVSNPVNSGFAASCNRGAREARGNDIVFLNNDTVPQPGWLAALVRGRREDGADICGARLVYPHGPVQHAGVAFHESGDAVHPFWNFPADHPAVNRKRWLQCVTAACMLVRRDLFLDLGGFDEGYRNGHEDVDFCLRAKEKGCRTLYVPDCVVVHFEETSEGRKNHDKENLEKFLARWKGRVEADLVRLYEEEGFVRTTGADGETIFVHGAVAGTLPGGGNGACPPKGGKDAARRTPDEMRPAGPAARGKRLKKEKRFAEAAEAFEEARAAGDASVLADLGDCLAQMGEPAEAERVYREALGENPCEGRAMVGLGVLALLGDGDGVGGAGRREEAALWFRAALARDDRDAAALCGLGLVLRKGGDPSGAFDLYRLALEADPVNLPALHELVTSAYELGRLGEAEERLAGYLMHRPADVNILFTLAGLRFAAGKRDDALEALDRLEAFAPGYDGALELRERIAGA